MDTGGGGWGLGAYTRFTSAVTPYMATRLRRAETLPPTGAIDHQRWLKNMFVTLILSSADPRLAKPLFTNREARGGGGRSTHVFSRGDPKATTYQVKQQASKIISAAFAQTSPKRASVGATVLPFTVDEEHTSMPTQDKSRQASKQPKRSTTHWHHCLGTRGPSYHLTSRTNQEPKQKK